MGIRSIFKRGTYGQRLINLEATGQQAIDALTQLRTQLPELRTQIEADPDLDSTERADAVAEVNAAITSLVAQVKTFADSL